mgnify:CR=1 FL=1
MRNYLALVLIIILYGIVSEMDYEDAVRSQIVYRCGDTCND